jgi:hypothetical protein
LHRADCSTPRTRRVRRGRGFTYVDERTGDRIVSAADDRPPAAKARAHARAGPRRGGSLAYKERGRWRDVLSSDINAYIKQVAGEEFTAKDSRAPSRRR